MYKQESVKENMTHKIFWDFQIQTNHLIKVRRQDREKKKRKKKENLPTSAHCRPNGPQNKNQRKRK